MHTPITAFYAGLLAFLFVYLSVLVMQGRRTKRIGLGDNNDKEMSRLIRAHANFAEYVPLILVLMLIAEINHIEYQYLHIAGASLVVGRILHAIGLKRHAGASWQRVAGMILSLIALLEIAILNVLVLYQPA
ncbi:MAPEG family protein [Paraglaciecola hydrolytica]|uniref:Glutathione S-transferase n=1 Tax=Paraglaciecola hydrolytica TaxID=1799789 RepID=A0A148KLV0_9ALTE|nr:MAPEG family protein [Paraglaciecola hydrolytica]KXI27303.1 glutathione S-transferase [Paraglaciecola hydrolytica]